jgi:hypothetical protein
MQKTPILFLIFNRPDTTQQVFDEIKKAKPSKLYVAADGPRKNMENEEMLCAETKKIIEQVDWECELKTLFRDENLGCKIAVSSAIDWFFDQVEEGIILEDDCLPSSTFFKYCEELLEKYRNDERIMMISGDNFQDGIVRGNGSYYFSKNVHIWGWASWKRAWNKYDVKMKTYPDFKKQNQIINVFSNRLIQAHWILMFDSVFSGKTDTWDYQWAYAVLANGGLSIIPNVNLISNIGFDDRATHTLNAVDRYSKMDIYKIDDISDPLFILQDNAADEYYFFKNNSLIWRIVLKMGDTASKLRKFLNLA